MDPLIRRGLRFRGLLVSAAFGLIIAIVVMAVAGEAGGRILLYVSIAIGVIAVVAWILTVLYLRTEKGPRNVQEYLAEREARRRTQ